MTVNLYIDGARVGHSSFDLHTVGQVRTVGNPAGTVRFTCVSASEYSDGWVTYYQVAVQNNVGYRTTRRGAELTQTGSQSGQQPGGDWGESGIKTGSSLKLYTVPNVWRDIDNVSALSGNAWDARNFYSAESVGEYYHYLYGTCNMSAEINVFWHRCTNMLVRDPATGIILRGNLLPLPIRDS